MIDVLSMMQIVLRDAGFTTTPVTVDHTSGICFEDDAVVGFGCAFEKSSELLSSWRAIETAFLMRHSQSLRSAGEKAWNVYVVLLSSQLGDSTTVRQVRWIEEDLERTRKITACGVNTREDLTIALLPLLPIQYQPVLAAENNAQRLERRLALIVPNTASRVLDDSVKPSEVIRLLGERS